MDTTSSAPGGLRRIGSVYKRLLWGTMDLFGITDSLWRKMMVAVGLQFAAGIALATVVVVFEGTAALAVAGGLLALAAIACFNTALIVREDLTGPLGELESSTEAVAQGTLDVDSTTIEQDDEVGSLAASFERMHEMLRVTDRQADALAKESFDDPALEESVPGEFGESLDRMAENLSTAISDLEARSALYDASEIAAETDEAVARPVERTESIRSRTTTPRTLRRANRSRARPGRRTDAVGRLLRRTAAAWPALRERRWPTADIAVRKRNPCYRPSRLCV